MTYLLNILYLGLGASALCFVTWNLAVKVLGAVKTSVCIYMVPVITVVTSVLVLKEPPYPAICSGKWNCKDTGRYSGEVRTAGAVWAVGLSQGLSLPLLSEKTGGEILRKRGIENGFTE